MMSGWYDGWREAKKRLESEPDDTFLQNLVDNLRGLALQEYVEQFAYVNGYEYPEQTSHITEQTVTDFLVGLDELREGAKGRPELRAVLSALTEMERLNYTGDHTHFEVLADARVVLGEVLHGRPFPKLERFRCPSLHEGARGTVFRCVFQLPHGNEHEGHGADSGVVRWADEQSVNPPVPYVDGVQAKPYADKIDSPDRCTSAHTFDRGPLKGSTYQCSLLIGHPGKHESAGGSKWMVSDSTIAEAEEMHEPVRRCSEWLDAAGQRGHCEHNEGHNGPHDATGYGQWVSDCGAEHVLTETDGGAETVHCSMYRGHAGPSHFDVRSGSSWPVA
jgi:hypothetical protein